jgi:mRNA interferase RelE/StbE
LPSEFVVVETPGLVAKIAAPEYRAVYDKAKRYVYPLLRTNPFYGANIKKLRGELSGVYRYRIGDFCLFYTIQKHRVVVVLVDLERRKDADR